MIDVEELERRVAALEASAKTDVPALKRDLRRILSLQDDELDQLEALNRRIAALELAVTANARTAERGFAETHARLDRVEADVAQIKVDVSGLRRDLPAIIGDVLREVLKGSREG